MKYKINILIVLLCTVLCGIRFTTNTVQIATLQYSGGGDWYSNPTALPNLIEFANTHIPATISTEVSNVFVGSTDIFQYPYVYMTGHGNVHFSADDVENLRTYLQSGGFLHIDDNYGLDEFVRREMKKVFPEQEFVELPRNHSLYNQHFSFPKGLPKIHEHDGKPAQGFGLFHDGRLVCFYTYECDLGNGWENKEVHSLSAAKRQEALQMGANILEYVFTH
jgi:hypothetical protein